MNWHRFNDQFRESFWERQERQRKARNAARAASVDERPEGRDGNRLGAEPASAIGVAETPKTSPIEAEIERLGGGR